MIGHKIFCMKRSRENSFLFLKKLIFFLLIAKLQKSKFKSGYRILYLEEIKKNPSTRNELNNILRVFPPKGLYNRNTGRLSVYE